jgi:hypothetical protein
MDGWIIFLFVLIPIALGLAAYGISAAYATYQAWRERRRCRQAADENDAEAGGAGGAGSYELR